MPFKPVGRNRGNDNGSEANRQTRLISGSTKGIGFAIAAVLAREGAKVIINGRTEASVLAALSEIRRSVPKATIEGFAGDLGTPQAAELLGKKFPSVDILVNNLGIFEPKPLNKSQMTTGGGSSRSMY